LVVQSLLDHGDSRLSGCPEIAAGVVTFGNPKGYDTCALLPLRSAGEFRFAVLLVEVAMFRTNGLWAVLGVLLSAATAFAGELPIAEAAAEPAIGQIASLIEQFNHPEFGQRQSASQQLEEAGSAALAHLETAVAAGSREASNRSLDILKRHFQSGSDELKLAAREALQRLAQNSSPSMAQRARNVLNPPQIAATTTPVRFQPAIPPQINLFGGPAPANPAAFRRISVSDINGRKVIDIDDRERHVIMETAPAGGIQVAVTDKQNRRNPMRKLEAKDLDDLKRKDAELGRLFEQHRGAGFQPPIMGSRTLPLR
jgi:hypothetical protein